MHLETVEIEAAIQLITYGAKHPNVGGALAFKAAGVLIEKLENELKVRQESVKAVDSPPRDPEPAITESDK